MKNIIDINSYIDMATGHRIEIVKIPDGTVEYNEYDECDNQIHVWRTSDGITIFEMWGTYDSHGNNIYYRDSNGFEVWYEYDSNGNEIHSYDSNGYENWYEYDSNGNEIHYRNSDGYEEWY